MMPLTVTLIRFHLKYQLKYMRQLKYMQQFSASQDIDILFIVLFMFITTVFIVVALKRVCRGKDASLKRVRRENVRRPEEEWNEIRALVLYTQCPPSQVLTNWKRYGRDFHSALVALLFDKFEPREMDPFILKLLLFTSVKNTNRGFHLYQKAPGFVWKERNPGHQEDGFELCSLFKLETKPYVDLLKAKIMSRHGTTPSFYDYANVIQRFWRRVKANK
jgi:hypothetical protein